MAAARGTSSRISRRSATTRSRKPTRSPTPSSASDFDDLREELGDLLLQPVFHAQMASEAGLFDFGDVVQAITEKLIRRHPHVFGEQAARDAGGAKARGTTIKADERRQEGRGARRDRASVLDDVPHGPARPARAEKLTKRAAKVGFDWPDWRER